MRLTLLQVDIIICEKSTGYDYDVIKMILLPEFHKNLTVIFFRKGFAQIALLNDYFFGRRAEWWGLAPFGVPLTER